MYAITHKEVFVENLNLIIANNLKQIRENKKISLDKVAEMTGVSKSMLGQIERGESNPTITTVWKIANGLKVSFTSLINYPQPEATVISRAEIKPMIEDNGKFRIYPLFPYENGRGFEVFSIEIDQGGYSSSDAHWEGTQEFFTVFDGEVTVRVNNQDYIISQGDSFKFRADKTHSYHNSGLGMARLSMVIYYPQ